MVFTRQLATLIDAGLPLLRGLNVLSKQEQDVVLKGTIDQLAEAVQGGSTFSESLAQHPRIFDKLYVNMVKAGELGGVLELVLNRLAEFQEKAQKVKNKVVAAMIYPAIVLCSRLRHHVVPARFHRAEIPADLSRHAGRQTAPGHHPVRHRREQRFQGPLAASFSAASSLLVALYKFVARTVRGRAVIDGLKLRAPLFGDLTRKSSISRFARTLGTLVTSGVPILQALNITRETAGNVVIAGAITQVHDSVKEGESIVQPLEASGAFPPMVISMIDVGEETGQLPEMLLKIAEVYDDEVDNSVAALTSMLEPIMIVLLALIVGTIVIALFMPLISIIGGLQAQS